MKSGLVSISFRDLTPQQIIRAVKNARLQSIEWGGDVHVPAGNIAVAEQVGQQTREAGLEVAAYGSYYYVGCQNSAKDFEKVLASARALGAPLIRVWAYNQSSGDVEDEAYHKFLQDALSTAKKAAAFNINIAYECHNNTLTDNYDFALKLMKDLDQPNVFMYWQPNQLRDEDYNQKAVRALAPYITNVHVFQWDEKNRYKLAKGKLTWQRYLDSIRQDEKEH